MEHRGTQRLETQRLVLRCFEIADAEAMYRNWASDDGVTTFLTWPTHENVEVSKDILEQWVESYSNDRWYQWAIVPKDGKNEPIGSMSAVRVDDATEKVEIGYCIGRQWWHQGITSEALAAVIAFFFGEVKANRVEAKHDSRNPHSGGVMRKCGMTYEGTLRSFDINNQGICDVCCYGILRDEWQGATKPACCHKGESEMASTLSPNEIRNEGIRLVKVNHDNFYELMKLSVTEEQENYVASNSLSMSEAFACLSNGDFIECFGVYNGEVPVGFAMLCHDPADDDDPEGCYCIWRFMIDQRYQGRGFGHDALKLIMDHILTFPDGEEDECFLSYEPENVVAKNLYSSFGFKPTGEYDDDEEVAHLKLR